MESALTGEFGFECLDEADTLENDPALYGGHTAIVMFSKMRDVRVLIHNTRNLDLPLAETTHPEAPTTATIVRIAYNGVNHYDAATRHRLEFISALVRSQICRKESAKIFWAVMLVVTMIPGCPPKNLFGLGRKWHALGPMFCLCAPFLLCEGGKTPESVATTFVNIRVVQMLAWYS